ncbi:sulfite oxidase [Marmoricola endophyticus]|uniref:Sulfite oxidase n=1 Tax=Marmoricola endophyticus TaxID=2040280 RepID=A0A917BPQ3_9ACTN|nr:sulfite oxidase [Marmoricola endophyticus]GGF52623.1 sulfite oxidase [Marmoricola endophyticus]
MVGTDPDTGQCMCIPSHGKRLGTTVHEQSPFNAEPPAAALADPGLTRQDAFYSRNHGPVPEIDAHEWRLDVEGTSYSLDELAAGFDQHTVTATMQCAGNRRADLVEVREIPGEDPWRRAIGTARWTGVRLGDVLAAVGAPLEGHVAFSAPDVSTIPDPASGYGSSVPMTKARAPETLLAWRMNDVPLPALHGGPVRVVVPGYVGARSVKWVEQVRVQPEPSENYFQATAYRVLPPESDPDAAGPGDGISLGPWALNCDILSPQAGDLVPSGDLLVEGYALAAEHRAVARVDVCVDGATWTQAELLNDLGPWAWRRWRVRLPVTAGRRTVVARAWDDTGAQQPSDPAHLWNPKGYANTAWPRIPVEVR